MSITALLIASHPDHAYAIFGLAWFLTLHALAVGLEGKRWLRHLGVDLRRRERIVLKRRPEGL